MTCIFLSFNIFIRFIYFQPLISRALLPLCTTTSFLLRRLSCKSLIILLLFHSQDTSIYNLYRRNISTQFRALCISCVAEGPLGNPWRFMDWKVTGQPWRHVFVWSVWISALHPVIIALCPETKPCDGGDTATGFQLTRWVMKNEVPLTILISSWLTNSCSDFESLIFTHQHRWCQQQFLDCLKPQYVLLNSKYCDLTSSRKIQCLCFNWWALLC